MHWEKKYSDIQKYLSGLLLLKAVKLLWKTMMQTPAVHQHCTEKSVPRSPCEESTYWHFLKYNTDAFDSNMRTRRTLALFVSQQNKMHNIIQHSLYWHSWVKTTVCLLTKSFTFAGFGSAVYLFILLQTELRSPYTRCMWLESCGRSLSPPPVPLRPIFRSWPPRIMMFVQHFMRMFKMYNAVQTVT